MEDVAQRPGDTRFLLPALLNRLEKRGHVYRAVAVRGDYRSQVRLLAAFGLESLRDLPDAEQLADAGLADPAQI